jgi:hypothetical protein
MTSETPEQAPTTPRHNDNHTHGSHGRYIELFIFIEIKRSYDLIITSSAFPGPDRALRRHPAYDCHD